MRWRIRRIGDSDNILVNFYGQVVTFTYMPLGEPLQFLVDLTGEPTGIRLMLPARTRLVENNAFRLLKVAIEKEAYRLNESPSGQASPSPTSLPACNLVQTISERHHSMTS